MNFQTLEDKCSESEKYDCYNPEIDREIKTFPEPYLVHHRVTITSDYIIKGVQFEDNRNPSRHGSPEHVNIPHNRCQPDLYLYDNRNDLSKIPEENYNGAKCVTHAETVDKKTECVIYNLQEIGRASCRERV